MDLPIFDTGALENRGTPRTTQLTIRLVNTGNLPTKAGIEVYLLSPSDMWLPQATLQCGLSIP